MATASSPLETESGVAQPRCRSCDAVLTTAMCDLGAHPPCESFLSVEQLNAMEAHYPLKVWVCESCWLCQLEEFVTPEEIFREYAYFSSFSTDFVAHAKDYTAKMIERFGLGPDSLAMELASNDGYLLRWFVEAGVPVLGIEPARNVAEKAEELGVRTITEFFGNELADQLAAEGVRADLIAGNNVYAQVPDINDFVSAIPKVLAPAGVVTAEFPHLVPLLDETLFDTIYHEHFSYFSLLSFETILNRHGLAVFDVEEVWTHGGSLRVFAQHAEGGPWPVSPRVAEWRDRERALGYDTIAPYREFEAHVWAAKRRFLEFLVKSNDEGQRRRGLRGAREGEHAAQLLRRRPRPHPLRRRPQPVQARAVLSGEPDPHPAGGAPVRHQAGRHRHHALEPARRDRQGAGAGAGVGGADRRAAARGHRGLSR